MSRHRHGVKTVAWWRHQMEPFSALLDICAGNSPVTDEFPAQRPVTRSIDAFFYLRLNKRLSKLLWDWCSETPSRSLWRHCNGALRTSQMTRCQIFNHNRLVVVFFDPSFWTIANLADLMHELVYEMPHELIITRWIINCIGLWVMSEISNHKLQTERACVNILFCWWNMPSRVPQ